MKNLYLFFFLLIFLPIITDAQHHDPVKMDEDSLNEGLIPMHHSFSLKLPMNRNGSGTGWLPDASPLHGYMKHSGKWMIMFHGSIFFRYNKQNVFNNEKRGGEKWDAPNWFMAMGQRKLGSRGLIHINSMFSLDPLTVGNEGYPLLFQTGETYNGKPLIDRQHPHDLIDELSFAYSHMISKHIDLTAYIAYPGEPGFGPVAFMHRFSSLSNPDAPLGHHWQDATHITFGVATLGLRYKKFKVEGSSFTGREPDENRYNFDKAWFNSYSFRIMFNPNDYFSFQISHAYLESPEVLQPEKDIKRETFSLVHSKVLGGMHWNSSVIWGYNFKKFNDGEQSYLFESNIQRKKSTIYGRYEIIEKDNLDLGIPHQNGKEQIFLINMLTLGFSYMIMTIGNTELKGGLHGSFYSSPKELDPFYGTYPISVEAYLNIIPAKLNENARSGCLPHQQKS